MDNQMDTQMVTEMLERINTRLYPEGFFLNWDGTMFWLTNTENDKIIQFFQDLEFALLTSYKILFEKLPNAPFSPLTKEEIDEVFSR